mgnify:CR=1 FL=1
MGQSQTHFSHGELGAEHRVVLKCQFSGHIEILLAAYCELDWDISVSQDKEAKTNVLSGSRVINYT